MKWAAQMNLIESFYALLLMTRRRHHLPPQPKDWFRNLAKSMGDALAIRLARKDGAPVAALLTLRHRSTIIYKYGCSDEAFHQLGGMPFLFWKLIEEGKATGAERIDFGRSEMENEGLVAFKDKFGTTKRILTYYRYPRSKKQSAHAWGDSGLARRFFSILPDGVLVRGRQSSCTGILDSLDSRVAATARELRKNYNSRSPNDLHFGNRWKCRPAAEAPGDRREEPGRRATPQTAGDSPNGSLAGK